MCIVHPVYWGVSWLHYLKYCQYNRLRGGASLRGCRGGRGFPGVSRCANKGHTHGGALARQPFPVPMIQSGSRTIWFMVKSRTTFFSFLRSMTTFTQVSYLWHNCSSQKRLFQWLINNFDGFIYDIFCINNNDSDKITEKGGNCNYSAAAWQMFTLSNCNDKVNFFADFSFDRTSIDIFLVCLLFVATSGKRMLAFLNFLINQIVNWVLLAIN